MKALLAKKERGFYCSAAAFLCTVLGLVFFLLLASVSPEESENPTVITAVSFAALVLHAVVCFKDYYKVPSIAAYAASTVAFLMFMGGRASYLAFYFSGDVLNTGLSVFMILAAVCYLAALIAALLAVVFKQEKKDRAAFENKDIKVLAPVVLAAVILCVATVFLQGGTPGTAENGPQGEASDGPAGQTYKTPTVDESVWQGYDGAAYLAEDEGSKPIAYQLTGHTEIDTGETTAFDSLLNLYEDGESVLTVYGMNNVYTYFGYWTNEEDHLWFCVAHYGMAAQPGTCTIDYSYELTRMFDDVSVNIALGFANGGQYVRETPIGGSGEVMYTSVKDFLLEKGWTETDAGYRPLPGEAPGNDPAQNAILFSWESGSENYLLDCNADGTYAFTFATVGLVETGTWSWQDWTFTMTDSNGTVTTAEMDPDSNALKLHYTAASSDQLTWDFTCGPEVWGAAFNGTGSYEPVSAPSAGQPSVLFSWESGSENYLLDCNDDGTYAFTFATVGLVETGTWSWQDWTFTMTDSNGTVTTAEMDPDSNALKLHYTAASSDQLTWDFTCGPEVWGAAFNGTGSYEPVSAPSAGQPSVLFSWESGSENYLLDCNDDGTYAFTFATVGLVETGTWSWQDWTFTMTDSNGTVMTAEMESDTNALKLHYTAASSDQLTWDFTCDSGTWGYAFNGTGNYPAD